MGKITTLLVGLILLMIFSTGIFMFVNGLKASYGYVSTENFTRFYEAMNSTNIVSVSNETHNSFLNNMPSSNQTGMLSWFSWGDWYIKSFFEAIKSVSNTVPVMNSMIQSSGEALHIEWAAGFIMLAIGIPIILLIWGYAIGRDT